MRALVPCLLFVLCACKAGPNDHISTARAAIYEKKPELALKEYRLALNVLERDESPQARVYRARALRGAADVYWLELRDVKHAIEVYRELVQQCPEAPETLEGRIILAELLRVHRKDLRGAITELTAAIAQNPPQSAELSYQVAKLYFELGDYQQSELEAQNVIKKYESSAFVDDAIFLQGQALAMMEGRKAEATRAFQSLVERYPESDLYAHALFELGKIRSDLEENDKAIELWVRALKTHPDPMLVQSHIARVRRRITNTTPVHVGHGLFAADRAAEGHARAARAQVPRVIPKHKTSVEAAGGTPEEAARDYGD